MKLEIAEAKTDGHGQLPTSRFFFVIGSLVVVEVGHIHCVVGGGLGVQILMGGNTSGFYPSNRYLEKRLLVKHPFS